jgi:DNA-binding NarL/FixJ family response regulator
MVNALIVDDSEDMRFLVRATMGVVDGFDEITEAANGDEGLRQWRSRRPDVTILDYRMPGLSGLDVAEEILAEDPSSIVFLLSAYLDDATIERAERIGVADCIDKDQVREVVNLAKERLARRHG